MNKPLSTLKPNFSSWQPTTSKSNSNWHPVLRNQVENIKSYDISPYKSLKPVTTVQPMPAPWQPTTTTATTTSDWFNTLSPSNAYAPVTPDQAAVDHIRVKPIKSYQQLGKIIEEQICYNRAPPPQCYRP